MANLNLHQARYLFDAYDTDMSGALSRPEVAHMLHSIMPESDKHMVSETVKEMWRTLDLDNHSVLSRDDFCHSSLAHITLHYLELATKSLKRTLRTNSSKQTKKKRPQVAECTFANISCLTFALLACLTLLCLGLARTFPRY